MAHNDAGEIKAANGQHQERPLNGASIGAYVGDKNLPPVSFGGLITVDDKTYGMTVHHMLDDPSDGEDDGPDNQAPILRSSAQHMDMPDLTYSESSVYSSGDEEYMYSLSDYESDFSSDNESQISDGEDDSSEFNFDEEDETEPGDIKGIPLGRGSSYPITQPAIDDITEDFYPNDETRDEDHLDSFHLGSLHASSGIRRRVENSVVHEIDWALFSFNPERQPSKNHLLHGDRFCHQKAATYPMSIAPVSDLGGMNVHCVGRTSGLQSGRILPGMVVVKIFGRQTPSSSYQVAGGKLGIPGDSGAWVVDNEGGRACGHVLAWSTRKKVAYICPMDVLVRDIAETLGAGSVRLPGGSELLRTSTRASVSTLGKNKDPSNVEDELASLLAELNLPPTPEQIDKLPPLPPSTSASITSSISSHQPSSTNNLPHAESSKNFVPIRLMTRSDEQKTTTMPRHQHISFVKSARMSWEGSGAEDSDIERDSVGESSSLGIGNMARKIEQVGVGKRTPPPPPPRRGEIRAGV